MNKKRLSVVMAGAMLATSVAPVLAAETTTGTEIAFNQKKAFAKQILNKMAEKKISNFAIFKEEGNPFVSSDIQAELAKLSSNDFESAYGVKIIAKNGTVKADTVYSTTGLEAALLALNSGEKVEVYERETTDFDGQLIPGTGLKKTSKPEAYGTAATAFDGLNGSNFTSQIVKDLAIYKDNKTGATDGDDFISAIIKASKITKGTDDKLTLTTEKKDAPVNGNPVVYKYKYSDNKLDGRLAYNADNKLIDATDISSVQEFDHFGELVNWAPSTEAVDKGAKLVATYTIGEKEADATKETLKVSDLFDGIALTARGTEIVADLANAKEAFDKEGTANEKPLVLLNKLTDFDNTNAGSTGIYKFTVSYYKNGTLAKAEADASSNTDIETAQKAADKVISVTSTDLEELKGLYNILKENEFNVGVVAGQNRYETAINVSKQLKLTKFDKDAATNNIVLVNGESLVDGLAAAPLAASKEAYQDNDGASTGKAKSAPLLLTQSDKLPEATKEYIESLIKDLDTTAKKNVKVHLVGGSSVLETSLVNELKEMGLTVVRHGGDNREETSISVAKALPATKKAFVVGANGEADAMSISAVASKTGAITPIIVAKAGGMSESALDYLEGIKADDVTIVGGTKAVTEKEEAKINKALVGAKAMRLSGENRIETNNKIIEKYYSNATAVVSVKDGIAKKSELVDALSAANYAAANNAPIVLATSKVTEAQKNTLLKTTGTVTKVVQVGIGAERTVLETLANLLNVTNKVK